MEDKRMSRIIRFFKELWPHAAWAVLSAVGATLISGNLSLLQWLRTNLDFVTILSVFAMSFVALALICKVLISAPILVPAEGAPTKSRWKIWTWFGALVVVVGLGIYVAVRLQPVQKADVAPHEPPPVIRSGDQRNPLPDFEEADLIGDWQWHYPGAGWEGTVTFSRRMTGIAFAGVVYQADVKPKKLLYQWQGGTARLIGGRQLELEANNVEDRHYKDNLGNYRKISWKTNKPLRMDFAFVGDLVGTESDGRPIPDHWGFALYHPSH
jgi:hypothetical protein